jgi:hypothetical protein
MNNLAVMLGNLARSGVEFVPVGGFRGGSSHAKEAMNRPQDRLTLTQLRAIKERKG